MDYSRLSMPLGEAIFTQRSIRRFKPDPIPLADLQLILEAAVKAPNGGNQQLARFLVVTDRDDHPRVRPALPRGVVGQASRRGIPAAGGSARPLPSRRRTGRRDGGRAVHRLRVGAAQRAGQLRHPRRAEPDARGACARHRLGADDAPPVRHGSLPRDVRHPRRCRLPFLRPARLSAGQLRSERRASRLRRRPSSTGGTLRFPGIDRAP